MFQRRRQQDRPPCQMHFLSMMKSFRRGTPKEHPEHFDHILERVGVVIQKDDGILRLSLGFTRDALLPTGECYRQSSVSLGISPRTEYPNEGSTFCESMRFFHEQNGDGMGEWSFKLAWEISDQLECADPVGCFQSQNWRVFNLPMSSGST